MTSEGERSICVVHLVWAPLGLSMLEEFLSAYSRQAAGLTHKLAVIFNGFSDPNDSRLAEVESVLEDVEHESVITPRPELDLAAYLHAAAELDARAFCFLNSYSRPLADGWLAKLAAALEQPGVALAGATGSWASTCSLTAHTLGLPSAYRRVLPARRAAIEQFMAVEADKGGPAPERPVSARDWVVAGLRRLRELPVQTLPYARFPAYHVRTNGFMISKATLEGLRLRPVYNKQDAYRVENGRRSLTRQILRKGQRTVVVDSEGRVHDPPNWPRSATFWQGDQEGLLIADNQTRAYAEATLERRRLLAGYAWGAQARPTPPLRAA